MSIKHEIILCIFVFYFLLNQYYTIVYVSTKAHVIEKDVIIIKSTYMNEKGRCKNCGDRLARRAYPVSSAHSKVE
jgi:hypothetical protein